MPRFYGPARLAFPADAGPEDSHHQVTLIYVAAALLVMAQVLGIYALKTRKADFIFAIVMAVLLLGAVLLGGYGVYHRLH